MIFVSQFLCRNIINQKNKIKMEHLKTFAIAAGAALVGIAIYDQLVKGMLTKK